MQIIIFLLTNFLLLSKLIIYIFIKLFVISNVLAKGLLLAGLLGLLYVLYRYPRSRFSVLSKLRNYRHNLIMRYAMKSKIQHIYNIFILCSSSFIFVIFIFYLRLLNIDHSIDLREKYLLLQEHLFKTSLFEYLLNVNIFILFCFIYILGFSRITKYVKFHFIKRHIYLVGSILEPNDWYVLGIYYSFLNKYSFADNKLQDMIRYLYTQCYFKHKKKEYPANIDMLPWETQQKYMEKPPMDPIWFISTFTIKYSKLYYSLWFLITKGHYILIFFVIIFDIVYNNYQIVHIFNILPWIFLYDLYQRFSNIIQGLNISLDEYIYTFIYSKSMEISDEKTIIIDGRFYNYQRFKLIYKYYILGDFINSSKVY